jgi:phospholipase D1/2
VRRYLRPIAAILIATGLLVLLSRMQLTRYVGLSEMKSLMSRVSPYEPLVFGGFCFAAIILRLPMIFVIALGGALFGMLHGFLYGWIGSVLGAFGAFLLARYALKEFFQRKVAPRFPWLDHLDARLAKNGLQTVLLLRFFLFMSPVTNWIVGVSRLKFRDYAIGTMIGTLPLMILLNYWGDKIAAADSLWVLAKPEILVPGLLVLLLVAGGGLMGRRFLSRTPAKVPSNLLD